MTLAIFVALLALPICASWSFLAATLAVLAMGSVALPDVPHDPIERDAVIVLDVADVELIDPVAVAVAWGAAMASVRDVDADAEIATLYRASLRALATSSARLDVASVHMLPLPLAA